jgi:mannose-1-phosphate guanylyltransferase
VSIVAAQHRRWWATELAEFPRENVISQPKNRGTAAGILLPLLWIAERDPDARVVILPSDHDVASEATLHTAIMDTLLGNASSCARLVLLGVRPEGPETGYGWIVPSPGEQGPFHAVASFKEKPDATTAASLVGLGALLNCFIMIADLRSLLELFQTELPQLWGSLYPVFHGRAHDPERQRQLAELYASIPIFDFSKDLLERTTADLWVYPVPACGWLDLGTPERLARHLHARGRQTRDRRTPEMKRRPSQSFPSHQGPLDHLETSGGRPPSAVT